MPPFPEVTGALERFKEVGYFLCIVSNTDDEIIAGNVAQLGGLIDRGTGRAVRPDYTPDATLATLDQVPALFNRLGW